MHEYSITCSIIEILNDLVKKHNIKKLKKVSFELGPFTHIEPESIKFYYDCLTKNNDTINEAVLDFKRKKIQMKCMDCGRTFQSKKIILKCRYCSGNKVKIQDSDEIKIISIETE
jgi:hydrogenase nickel insertion protein HypA